MAGEMATTTIGGGGSLKDLDLVARMEHQERTSAAPFEEKKEDEPYMASAAEVLQDLHDAVEEEGQEALWVEEDIEDAVPADNIPGSPSRRFFINKTQVGGNVQNAASIAATKKQSHVLLLPLQPKKPSPLDTVQVTKSAKDNSRRVQVAADKVNTARKLLEQALSPSANIGSRDLLAQAAFNQAAEARRMMEATCTPELETMLADAKVKGTSEAAQARRFQMGETLEPTSPTMEDEHAARARSLLEFILPEVDTSKIETPTGRTGETDEISTLGFDNTFSKSNSKDFDIMSMSSLNEILDGPIDESPVIKHRIVPEAGTPKENANNVVPQETKETTSSRVTKNGPSSKKPGLFGVIFRGNRSKASNGLAESAPERHKGVGLPKPLKNRPAATKKEASAPAPESRIVTNVMYDDGVMENEQHGEISNLNELERIKAIDEKLNRSLQDAIATDENGSLTSWEGVPLHGKNEKANTKDGKRKDKKEKQVLPDEEPLPKKPPRPFEAVQPKFMAAPRGDPAILAAKSWESLNSNESEEPKALPAVTLSQSNSSGGEDKPPTPGKAEKDPVKEASPPSPSSLVDSPGDRYTVAVNDDRYTILGDDEDHFEAFWNPCGASTLPEDDCSALCGTGQQDAILNDKYASATTIPDVDESAMPLSLNQPDSAPVAESMRIVKLEKKTTPPRLQPVKKSTAPAPVLVASKPTRSPVTSTVKKPGLVAGLFGKKKRKATPPRKAATQPKITPLRHQNPAEKIAAAPQQTPSKIDTTPASAASSTGPMMADTTIEPRTVTPNEQAPQTDEEDPLVAQIKEQQYRQKRGPDPITQEDEAAHPRGMDP